MSDAKTTKVGSQLLSESVYFIDNEGNKLSPIYQKDIDTGARTYRVYINGGNTKDDDLDVHCHKELAKYLIDGHSVRCRVQSGRSSNRKLSSRDIVKLVVEIENA
ncbi:MAG: hypothetical protein R3E62_03395 [Pseudomonadales bacterium]